MPSFNFDSPLPEVVEERLFIERYNLAVNQDHIALFSSGVETATLGI